MPSCGCTLREGESGLAHWPQAGPGTGQSLLAISSACPLPQAGTQPTLTHAPSQIHPVLSGYNTYTQLFLPYIHTHYLSISCLHTPRGLLLHAHTLILLPHTTLLSPLPYLCAHTSTHTHMYSSVSFPTFEVTTQCVQVFPCTPRFTQSHPPQIFPHCSHRHSHKRTRPHSCTPSLTIHTHTPRHKPEHSANLYTPHPCRTPGRLLPAPARARMPPSSISELHSELRIFASPLPPGRRCCGCFVLGYVRFPPSRRAASASKKLLKRWNLKPLYAWLKG